jgi:hypothetical protein
MNELVTRSLSIKLGASEIFATTENGMVLLPSEEQERAEAFLALTDALALLAGIKLPQSTLATASDAAQCSRESPPSPADGHKSGDIVHLGERRGSRNEGTLP